ncbi:M14 family metallopeptidase [Pendulispora albinea]|uniref:M14 family metallopeptidase n=1 Tax=Pendulispora albinea TaxID=2741071 RepID=A0ABZ2M1J7_9BACT
MPLQTIAEKSGYRATSTHAEVMAFIQELQQLGSPYLRVSNFGHTPQGRELPLLVLSSTGVSDPAAARALGRPVVLLQNCIHAGEVEGKESVLMLVRDLLTRGDEGLLEKLTVVVLPIFNADGNDAMDPENRALHIERLIGQDGPPRVGTRVNAKGINLNRDYIRQEAPEMRLLQTRVCHTWEPDLSVDSHATNGSVHRFAMTHDIPHTVESGRREPIDFMRHTLVPEISQGVRRNFGLESGWYGNFVEDERTLDERGTADPNAPVGEGWMTYPHHPRFGGNYRGLTNRLDLLLECYSYLTFEERVRTTYAWLIETLRAAAGKADAIRDLIEASRMPPARVAVGYGLEAMPEPVKVLTRRPRTREGEPHEVDIPFLARFVGTNVVDRPRAYVLPAHLGPFLRGHGLRVEEAPAQALVEIPRFEGFSAKSARAILEASTVGQCDVSWTREARSIPPGSLLLPTEQPLGAVAVYLSEPESDDGVVTNGLLPVPKVGEEFAVLRVVDG